MQDSTSSGRHNSSSLRYLLPAYRRSPPYVFPAVPVPYLSSQPTLRLPCGTCPILIVAAHLTSSLRYLSHLSSQPTLRLPCGTCPILIVAAHLTSSLRYLSHTYRRSPPRLPCGTCPILIVAARLTTSLTACPHVALSMAAL